MRLAAALVLWAAVGTAGAGATPGFAPALASAAASHANVSLPSADARAPAGSDGSGAGSARAPAPPGAAAPAPAAAAGAAPIPAAAAAAAPAAPTGAVLDPDAPGGALLPVSASPGRVPSPSSAAPAALDAFSDAAAAPAPAAPAPPRPPAVLAEPRHAAPGQRIAGRRGGQPAAAAGGCGAWRRAADGRIAAVGHQHRAHHMADHRGSVPRTLPPSRLTPPAVAHCRRSRAGMPAEPSRASCARITRGSCIALAAGWQRRAHCVADLCGILACAPPTPSL